MDERSYKEDIERINLLLSTKEAIKVFKGKYLSYGKSLITEKDLNNPDNVFIDVKLLEGESTCSYTFLNSETNRKFSVYRRKNFYSDCSSYIGNTSFSDCISTEILNLSNTQVDEEILNEEHVFLVRRDDNRSPGRIFKGIYIVDSSTILQNQRDVDWYTFKFFFLKIYVDLRLILLNILI